MARSRCETCEKLLGPSELVPIFSFLSLGGRCRSCGAAIARFHLWVELAAVAVALWATVADSGFRVWADCVLGWGLLALAWIDVEQMVLPDVLTLPLVILGLGWSFVEKPENIVDHAVGAIAGYALFRLVAWTYRQARAREGLGEGDAKLLAAAGAWTTWQALGDIVLLAAAAGLALALFKGARGSKLTLTTTIPFGSCLALATWLVWLYGPFVSR